jgi:hypothetical protein
MKDLIIPKHAKKRVKDIKDKYIEMEQITTPISLDNNL